MTDENKFTSKLKSKNLADYPKDWMFSDDEKAEMLANNKNDSALIEKLLLQKREDKK